MVKSEPSYFRPAQRGTDFTPVVKRWRESGTQEGMMMKPENLPEMDESKMTEISQTDVESVQAESVRMRQAAAETINADEVEMQQSAAGSLTANQVSAHQSALGKVEAAEVLSHNSAIGFVQAEKASVSGRTVAVAAGSAQVQGGVTGVVVGQVVHVEDSRTILLVSRNVQGNVTTLMDSRAALIAGLTGGLFSGLMLLLGRMLFGRR